MEEQVTKPKKGFLGATPKEKRNNIIVILLSLLLVGLLVVFLMQRNEYQGIVREISNEKDSIQVQLNSMLVSYDSLQTENEVLNEEIYKAQTKVKDLLVEIEQTKKLSIERISKYQNEVNSLRGIMKDFVAQIDSLNERNKILMAQNIEIKEQVKKAQSQNQQLIADKTKLQQNLEIASQLEVSDISAVALNNRNKDVKVANRTAKFRINFTLARNISAKRGAKNVYIRIMRPDQLLLTKSNDDLFKFENMHIPFSAVREVTYEGNDLPVAIYWEDDEGSFMSGTYSIDIFADGNHLGKTTLTLK